MFWIPAVSMVELKQRIRTDRLYIAAQVHSHPREAFHSPADDKWAIVRHEGALSIVLPYFAERTTIDSFMTHAKVFAHAAGNRWQELTASEVELCLKVV